MTSKNVKFRDRYSLSLDTLIVNCLTFSLDGCIDRRTPVLHLGQRIRTRQLEQVHDADNAPRNDANQLAHALPKTVDYFSFIHPVILDTAQYQSDHSTTSSAQYRTSRPPTRTSPSPE
uniref:(northern house mosquito) hypothetical protein n=1 Tax=Culex pipiens TaxID=7175 RepID=A0A8D8FU95_CULPI